MKSEKIILDACSEKAFNSGRLGIYHIIPGGLSYEDFADYKSKINKQQEK